MWTCKIAFLFYACASILCLSVCAFDDPISLLGRIRWNYTAYEENLWTRSYHNTSLDQIYNDHNTFIKKINRIFSTIDPFYPTFNGSTGSLKNIVVEETILSNPNNVPVLSNIVILNVQVLDYWFKFSNFSSSPDASNVLEVLMDDAIPTLQTALATFWNPSSTNVFFSFLQNVRNFHFK